jgi:hypothetical protein
MSKLKYFSQQSYPPPPGLRNTDPLRPVGGLALLFYDRRYQNQY